MDEYVKKTPKFKGKVKVVHQEKRQGLMRSRMAGIRAATADILVFLDSHIEAGIGWLEPLLFRILEDPKVSYPLQIATKINKFWVAFSLVVRRVV